jgi:hypothetical protein
MENLVRDYILDMRKRNLSLSTINCSCAALKHFFDINDFDLRWSNDLEFKLEEAISTIRKNQELERKENREYELETDWHKKSKLHDKLMETTRQTIRNRSQL